MTHLNSHYKEEKERLLGGGYKMIFGRNKSNIQNQKVSLFLIFNKIMK